MQRRPAEAGARGSGRPPGAGKGGAASEAAAAGTGEWRPSARVRAEPRRGTGAAQGCKRAPVSACHATGRPTPDSPLASPHPAASCGRPLQACRWLPTLSGHPSLARRAGGRSCPTRKPALLLLDEVD